jgi:lipoprotein-anchoring transpeptidase ErfK/SrfK
MRHTFVSALVASGTAACAASALVPPRAHAGPVDADWQLAYDGSGVFTDETGQPVIARAYQPTPTYSQQVPLPPPGYRSAPAYYQPAPAPQQRANQQAPAPVYYQRAPAPQARVQQPAPVYYQPAPAPQARMQQPAPVYYQQAPAPQARMQQPAQPAQYQQPAPTPVAAAQPASTSSWQAPPSQPSAYGRQIYASAQPQQPQQVRGFLSALMGDQTGSVPQQGAYQPAVQNPQARPQQQAFGYPAPAYAPSTSGDMSRPTADPRYDRQLVEYRGEATPGTIIVDTPHFFLYLVLQGGKAIRYGIGVGRPGFAWAGVKEVSAMREWPDWRPPDEMLARRPDLPHYMPGGPDNPLGARALYLGSSLYRIHGSNEPWTIGTQVSSGCIRLRNDDIVDLYGRVKVGTKVVVI